MRVAMIAATKPRLLGPIFAERLTRVYIEASFIALASSTIAWSCSTTRLDSCSRDANFQNDTRHPESNRLGFAFLENSTHPPFLFSSSRHGGIFTAFGVIHGRRPSIN